jgi:class 3 adenylate cyclase
MTNKELQLLINEADTERNNGKYDDALAIATNALTLAETYKQEENKAEALNIIGLVYENLSDTAQAMEYLYKALAINSELGRKLGIAKNLGNLGNVYWQLSDYTHALEFYQKALMINEEIDNKFNMATNLGNIAVVYWQISDYPHALEYNQKALAINEEVDSKFGMANNFSNIGIIYDNLSDYPRALEYYQKALAILEKLDRKVGIAKNLSNIGCVYRSLLDYPNSLLYHFKSLIINEELGRQDGVAICLINIGSVYYDISKYSDSLEYFHKALKIFEELGRKDGVAVALGNIGSLYGNIKFDGYDLTKAEVCLFQAMVINDEIGSKRENLEVYKSIADLYKRQHKWEAIEYIEKYYSVKEEIQNEDAQKQAQRAVYERQIGEMQREQDVTERILHNILPKEIAKRIRRGDQKIVDNYQCVSVLFADIVGFTNLSQQVNLEQLVAVLDGIFNAFDLIADRHGCEKIKTIGDCYMIVAGLPERCDNHAERLGMMALDMLKAIEEFPVIVEDISITMRIGIHTGSVVAGIIGKNKYAYDLWGDAVNTASRMESHGEAGKIHCTEEFVRALSLSSFPSFHFQERGEMEIKGKGMMKTYFLERAQ